MRSFEGGLVSRDADDLGADGSGDPGELGECDPVHVADAYPVGDVEVHADVQGMEDCCQAASRSLRLV